MHIYKTQKYNKSKYSKGNPVHKQGHLYYGSCIVGIEVRGQIGLTWIYRRRPGNGYAGSKLKTVYQDRFKYFVPASINNPESDPYRANFRAAVDYWQNILTPAEKKEYDRKGYRKGNIPGYNQFIREALTGEFSMYVDRGDPASYDFTKDDLILDGNWHDLDISAIVPKTARAILFRGTVEGVSSTWKIRGRKYGNTNDIALCCLETLRANVPRCRCMILPVDHNQKIQYNADNQNWTTLSLVACGWWT